MRGEKERKLLLGEKRGKKVLMGREKERKCLMSRKKGIKFFLEERGKHGKQKKGRYERKERKL